MNWSRFALALSVLAVAGIVTGCFGGDEGDDEESSVVIEDGGSGDEDSGSATILCTEDNLAEGQTTTRTRYSSASVTHGLGSCTSETQTCTCSSTGTLDCDGSFTETSCTASYATVTGGDILFMLETSGDTDQNTLNAGAIIAFDKNGTFKGTVIPASLNGQHTGYAINMKLDVTAFSYSEYFLSVFGSAPNTTSLTVYQSETQIDPAANNSLAFPQELDHITPSGTDLVFHAGYSVEGRSKGRYVTDNTERRVNHYLTGSYANCYADYSDSSYDNWLLAGVFVGQFNGSTPVHVARAKSPTGTNVEVAVDSFTICSSGMTRTPSEVFSFNAGNGVLLRDVIHYKSFDSSSWDDSFFLQYSSNYGLNYYRHFTDSGGGSYTQDNTPFGDNFAVAMYHFAAATVDRSIWVLEYESGSPARWHIRNYDTGGNLVKTVYSGNDGEIFTRNDMSIEAMSMVVIPSE